jgi:hypothetical protein
MGVKGYEITSLNGERSIVYEITPPDLDQKRKNNLLVLYSQLERELNSLSSHHWYKVYKIGDKLYLNTTDPDVVLPECNLNPVNNPMDSFFKEELLGDIQFYEHYMSVGLEYWRIVHVQDQITSSHESFLTQYGCDYALLVKKVDPFEAKNILSAKRRTQSSVMNSFHQNHDAEGNYDQANTLLKEITDNTNNLYRVELYFIVKDEDFRSLNAKTRYLVDEIRKSGGKAFVETNALDSAFFQCVFGVRPTFLKSSIEDVEYLANLLPYHRDFIHVDGIPFLTRSFKEIHINFFEFLNSNSHCLITGESGEGKTYLLNYLVWYFFHQGKRLALFDMGKSMKKVACYLDASDFSNRFNPLQFRDEKYLHEFVLSIAGKNNFNKIEIGKIFSGIKDALDNNIKNFVELLDYIENYIPDFHYYFAGVMDYFSDEFITEIPQVIYVDNEVIHEELLAGYILFCRKLIASTDDEVVFVLDECDYLVEKCPYLIEENNQRGRKKGIANFFATQTVDKLFERFPSVAGTIMNNTYSKILFHQNSIENKSLDEDTKRKVTSVDNGVKSVKGEYSEFLFLTPVHSKICRLYRDDFFYELAHSEKEELPKQWSFLDESMEYLSFQESFDKWMRFKYE